MKPSFLKPSSCYSYLRLNSFLFIKYSYPKSSTTVIPLSSICIPDPADIDPLLLSRINQTPTHHSQNTVSIKTRRRQSHADKFALNTYQIPPHEHHHVHALEPETDSTHKRISFERNIKTNSPNFPNPYLKSTPSKLTIPSFKKNAQWLNWNWLNTYFNLVAHLI